MAKKQDNYNNLTGLEKSSIFLLAIGEEASSPLLEQMDDDELRELTATMATLGSVPSNIVEKLFLDFVDRVSNSSSLMGTQATTEKILQGALPKDKVESLMGDIGGPVGKNMWDKLGGIHESVLANYLKNEYPQTVAVILSKIQANHAAKVLSLLPENYALEVVMRMLKMEPIQREILENVEQTLRNEFMSNLANTRRRDNHEVIAEIFNNLDRSSENRFMTALEERNREAAERVKTLMFTFEDLIKLSDRGVQTLIRNLNRERLTLALKSVDDNVKDLFFRNMSERAGKLMLDDMEAMGPVRLRDVELAQSEIIAIVKSMADAGEIDIGGNSEGDELVG